MPRRRGLLVLLVIALAARSMRACADEAAAPRGNVPAKSSEPQPAPAPSSSSLKSQASRLPTADEVLVGYRQNLARLPQPHITIRRTLATTDELRRYWLQTADQLQKVVDDPERSPQQQAQARALLAPARDAARPPVVEREEHEDFWTDRTNWQLCRPYADAAGRAPPRHVFPSEKIATPSLESVFARYRVYTYAPAETPALSAWLGIPNPGAPPYARALALDELPNSLEFPPLGAIAGPTAFLAHPIDAIYFRPAGSLRVVGYEQRGDATLLRIERAWLAASDEPHTKPGKLLTGDVITAWVEPARGFLPVEVQWRRQWQFEGRLLNPEHHHLHQVVRATRIERLAGGAFYPLEGVVELRSPEPGSPALPEIDRLLAGEAYRPAMLTDRAWTWRVEKVEPRAAADPQRYRVKFPPNTEYFDPRVADEPLAPLRPGTPAPPLNVTRWTDGQTRTLADLKGQVIVLYFWTAWRDPCTAPLDSLEKLHQKYRSQGATVLGVHVGNVEFEELRRATDSEGVTFPNALDAGTLQTRGSTEQLYRAQFLPIMIVIDRRGMIAWSSADPNGQSELTATARRVATEKTASSNPDAEEAFARWIRALAVVTERQVQQALAR